MASGEDPTDPQDIRLLVHPVLSTPGGDGLRVMVFQTLLIKKDGNYSRTKQSNT